MILHETGSSKNEITPKLLIIDDSYSNISLLEKMLKSHGYNNIKALTDFRDVIDLYKTYKPDLLLLGLRLSYMNGFQIMKQLNALKGPDYLPIIMITTENDTEYRLEALENGAKDFISKPFDYTEVIMRIRNLLEIRMLHNKSQEYNRKLEDNVKERTKELEDLQLELLQRLLCAAGFRDNDTGNHISRIGLYVFQLAKAVGLSQKYCDMLLHASMMHDIGKIGISDDILLKPGELNAEEWEIMKTHTLKGAQILAESSSEIVQLAAQIALTHHEKWDGSGYPYKLKDEEIPFPSRITAICDAFDALLSERPYKKAWHLDDVINELKKGSGTHFDPLLVELFLKNIPIFVEIKKEFDEYKCND